MTIVVIAPEELAGAAGPSCLLAVSVHAAPLASTPGFGSILFFLFLIVSKEIYAVYTPAAAPAMSLL